MTITGFIFRFSCVYDNAYIDIGHMPDCQFFPLFRNFCGYDSLFGDAIVPDSSHVIPELVPRSLGKATSFL